MFCSQLVCNFYSWHIASMSVEGTFWNQNVRYFLYKAVPCSSSSASVLSFPHSACVAALRNSHSHVLWKFSKIETEMLPSELSNTFRESSKLIIHRLKHLSIWLENYLTVFNLWSRVCGELCLRLSAALGRGVRISTKEERAWDCRANERLGGDQVSQD